MPTFDIVVQSQRLAAHLCAELGPQTPWVLQRLVVHGEKEVQGQGEAGWSLAGWRLVMDLLVFKTAWLAWLGVDLMRPWVHGFCLVMMLRHLPREDEWLLGSPGLELVVVAPACHWAVQRSGNLVP